MLLSLSCAQAPDNCLILVHINKPFNPFKILTKPTLPTDWFRLMETTMQSSELRSLVCILFLSYIWILHNFQRQKFYCAWTDQCWFWFIFYAGEAVTVEDEVVVINSIVLPNKTLNVSVQEEIILWYWRDRSHNASYFCFVFFPLVFTVKLYNWATGTSRQHFLPAMLIVMSADCSFVDLIIILNKREFSDFSSNLVSDIWE